MLIYAISQLIFDRMIPMVLAIFGFGLLILVHECGHFIFAKLFGVGVPTFSIGMGPAIYQRQIGETTFQIGPLPIGGYVEIEHQSSTTLPEMNENSIANKPYWQKILIMLGGVLFNMLLAIGIFSGIFWHGMPTISINKITITNVISYSPAERAGINPGDIIVGVNKKLLTDYPKPLDPTIFGNLISGQPGDTISFIIERNFKRLSKTVIFGQNPKNQSQGFIGIMFNTSDYSIERSTPLSLPASLYNGLLMAISQGKIISQSIASMIKRRSMEGVGGPVMIISQGLKNVREGFVYFLMFLAFISINLAFINLLPLGIVDGGRILFFTLETIFRHKIPETINLIVNFISIILLVFLTILLTYRDIINILFRKS